MDEDTRLETNVLLSAYMYEVGSKRRLCIAGLICARCDRQILRDGAVALAPNCHS